LGVRIGSCSGGASYLVDSVPTGCPGSLIISVTFIPVRDGTGGMLSRAVAYVV